jgi:hypothetical protein
MLSSQAMRWSEIQLSVYKVVAVAFDTDCAQLRDHVPPVAPTRKVPLRNTVKKFPTPKHPYVRS